MSGAMSFSFPLAPRGRTFDSEDAAAALSPTTAAARYSVPAIIDSIGFVVLADGVLLPRRKSDNGGLP